MGPPMRNCASELKAGTTAPFVVAPDSNTFSHSRDALRPRFARNLLALQIRGHRECRMRAAPAVSCANSAKKAAHEHTGQRRASDIPCAMALRLITRSPRSGRARCHRRPSEALASLELDASIGASQDHASLPYASAALVMRKLLRPPRPAPRCDDGQRPSEWDGMAIDVPLICLL